MDAQIGSKVYRRGVVSSTASGEPIYGTIETATVKGILPDGRLIIETGGGPHLLSKRQFVIDLKINTDWSL